MHNMAHTTCVGNDSILFHFYLLSSRHWAIYWTYRIMLHGRPFLQQKIPKTLGKSMLSEYSWGFSIYCRQWDLNPYVVAHNRFWVCLVCHSDTPASIRFPNKWYIIIPPKSLQLKNRKKAKSPFLPFPNYNYKNFRKLWQAFSLCFIINIHPFRNCVP